MPFASNKVRAAANKLGYAYDGLPFEMAPQDIGGKAEPDNTERQAPIAHRVAAERLKEQECGQNGVQHREPKLTLVDHPSEAALQLQITDNRRNAV